MRAFVMVLLAATVAVAGPRVRVRTVPVCAASSAGEFTSSASCETVATPAVSPPATCACPASVVDSHGVPITTTRATAGLCSSSGGWGTLTNGQVSSCAAATPRTLSGTFLVEGTRTNYAKDSSTMTNGSVWQTWSAGGPAPPTKTATYATDPYGNASSVARWQFPSCAAANSRSFLYQTVTPAASPASGEVWLQGNDAGYSVTFCFYDTYTNPDGGLLPGDGGCAVVNLDAGVWQRVTSEGLVWGTAPVYIQVGCENASFIPGYTNTGAADVIAWGGQVEDGAFVSTPIATTAGATAARNADVISEPIILTSASAVSMAANYTPQVVPLTNATILDAYVDSNNYVIAYQTSGSKVLCDFHIGGVASTVTSTASLVAGTAKRVSCNYDDVTKTVCVAGACDTSAASLTLPKGAATLYIGTRSATGNEAWGFVGQICEASISGRCK